MTVVMVAVVMMKLSTLRVRRRDNFIIATITITTIQLLMRALRGARCTA